ncbi:hypothetical protein SAMN04487893_10666 [Myroides guanonis]|uniref:Uncharacterized protein n=1 Tax=Myroides guanonis TaxID=1150112 RepID=A0A1I3QPK1_9FLAO|nr:hypothetical protein SAMN04487893_10666 [Myroides guanonis]
MFVILCCFFAYPTLNDNFFVFLDYSMKTMYLVIVHFVYKVKALLNVQKGFYS